MDLRTAIPHNNSNTPPGASIASTLSPPTSPPPSASRRRGPQPAPYTIRSITGTEHCPTGGSPTSTGGLPPEKLRYGRQRIAVFRTASGAECVLPPVAGSDEEDAPSRPRISSVTDMSTASPAASRTDCAVPETETEVEGEGGITHITSIIGNTKPVEQKNEREFHEQQREGDETFDEGDGDDGSTYSHASAVNLDDLDDDDLAGLRIQGLEGETKVALSKQVLDMRRQSFANSFAKARDAKARDSKARESKIKQRDVVPVRPELQPHNESLTLMERCISALMEVLDLNLVYAKSATERFVAFHPLYTADERKVIAELLRETSARLRNETPTAWRTPLWGNRKKSDRNNIFRVVGLGANNQQLCFSQSSHNLTANIRKRWLSPRPHQLSNDTLVRSVVYGSHIIPGAQSAEAILLRMAGEFHREEITRKANRSERVDIPLSFAMTLTATLATFARLECSTSYRKYRSRNASNRRSSPHALIWLKTKYDGMRLSFAVTLHGESPCTILFKRPRIFSLRKIDDYATLVTEAKDILCEFGRDVLGSKSKD